jgi:hypothetical protein
LLNKTLEFFSRNICALYKISQNKTLEFFFRNICACSYPEFLHACSCHGQ